MNVSKQLLKLLEKVGVDKIFGVTGDALNALLDEIRKSDKVKWIGVKHEENAAFAAYAQAAVTGKLAVCAGTVGPGALHLINGLYNAKKERVPVVAITGQVAVENIGSGYFQEVNLNKTFEDTCTFQAIIRSPEQAPRVIQKALRVAVEERTVCRIELPVDISLQKASGKNYIQPFICSKPEISPNKKELIAAIRALNKHDKITIFAGEGCRNARDEVLALALKLKAPIVHTLKAVDIFDHDTPQVVGLTGLIGNPSGYHAVQKADLLLMLGTDFPYSNFIPDDKLIIQVDLRIENIGNRASVDIGILGDVKSVAKAMCAKVKEKRTNKFLQIFERGFKKWKVQMEKESSLSRDMTPLHPQLITGVVDKKASSDAIFVLDVGEATVWGVRHIVFNHNRRVLGSFNHGSMAVGLPAAIGAQAACPDLQVWGLIGDGAFAMSMHDFVTAVRYNWPIKLIVYNNGELGFVKMEMEEAGLPMFNDATSLRNPNFAEYAKLCGGDGVRVEKLEDIEPAVEKAIKSNKPFIIDVVTTSGELTLPPKITLEQAWGFTKSKAKELFLAAKGDREQWENINKEIKANF
jgi:thiamine pyrophosphate-dependent acetolactate synthase large subunit-like protein